MLRHTTVSFKGLTSINNEKKEYVRIKYRRKHQAVTIFYSTKLIILDDIIYNMKNPPPIPPPNMETSY